MALLQGYNQQEYYENNIHGDYQFVSLKDVVNQFMVAYVGENKLIPKIRKADVLFHAQRSLQELSFDTIPSFKSQEIEVPPSLIMALPHDYVNYTRVLTTDSSGIKHPLYPTKHTQNPFEVRQNNDGSYFFTDENEEVVNGDFSIIPTNTIPSPNPAFEGTDVIPNWQMNSIPQTPSRNLANYKYDSTNNIVSFQHLTRIGYGQNDPTWGHVLCLWQQIDISDKQMINVSADGIAQDLTVNGVNAPGFLRVGVTTTVPDNKTVDFSQNNIYGTASYNSLPSLFNLTDANGDASYAEWTIADGGSAAALVNKEILGIDVSNVNTAYIVVVSFHDFTSTSQPDLGAYTNTQSVDNVSVTATTPITNIQEKSIGTSTTWENYKSHTNSENTIHDYHDYENNVYWPNEGERYGLSPENAQVNGSYYIDQLRGNIHFSSILSGKTVVLDYISDGLGTEEEMRVHKFAEEAMYKSIAYAVLSTSSYGQQLVPRFKKEKFAETRKAKLRLSNFKLEELTQILRGKSKQIKH